MYFKKEVVYVSRKNQKRRRGEPKVDEHHILYTHHEWNDIGRWGKLLRNHPYYRKIIPIRTLHNTIHNQIPFIPPVSNEICKFIYEATEQALMRHTINTQCDTIEMRIDFFLNQIILCDAEEECAATILALQKQRKIVADYYAKHSFSNLNSDHKIPTYRDRTESFHILFPNKIWGIKGYGKVLSENSYFVPRISRCLINEIYRSIHQIRKPQDGYILKNVNQKLEHARKLKNINPREDSLQERIYFLSKAFREEGALETATDLECIIDAITLFYKQR